MEILRGLEHSHDIESLLRLFTVAADVAGSNHAPYERMRRLVNVGYAALPSGIVLKRDVLRNTVLRFQRQCPELSKYIAAKAFVEDVLEAIPLPKLLNCEPDGIKLPLRIAVNVNTHKCHPI